MALSMSLYYILPVFLIFTNLKNTVLHKSLKLVLFCLSQMEYRLSVFQNIKLGLPWWLTGKEYACQCKRYEFHL